MNYHEHARLSAAKFGGVADDYLAIHRFLDSSKLFYFHVKHRLLLHNLYGVELAMERFGDTIENSDGKIALVREVARAHCREDLSGRLPSLRDWLAGRPALEDSIDPATLPRFDDPALDAFMYRPYLRSGLPAALILTFSDFGLYLVETFFGVDAALEVGARLAPVPAIKDYLDAYRFTADWQYTPRMRDMEMLRENREERTA